MSDLGFRFCGRFGCKSGGEDGPGLSAVRSAALLKSGFGKVADLPMWRWSWPRRRASPPDVRRQSCDPIQPSKKANLIMSV